MRSVNVLSCILFCVIACGRSGGQYLDREVTPSDVIGSWRMTQASVQNLRDVGHTAPIEPEDQRIDIRADGSCFFSTFPPEMARAGRSVPKIEVHCTWKLQRIGHPALVIDVLGQPPFQAYYHFRESEGALVLWQYISDPDAWLFVEYVRTPTQGGRP